ncbi:hypothetical protein B9N43_00180 [Denitratisoma sp. DHT3]|nr:hypothetical protein B9N43_00180 [Denitratisoma sp. DHT3]
MLVGAINYGLSLGHAFVFLLTGLGIAAILATFRNLARLRITPGRAEPVFAGDTAFFGLVLHNPRPDSRPELRLRAGNGAAVAVNVPGGDCIEAALPVPAAQRGWLPLPRVTLETSYPLGLVRAWAYAVPALNCLVYPRPAPLAPPLPLGDGGRTGGLRQSGGGDDFAGLRSHQPGDPRQHVAWKAAARHPEGELLTKTFAGESARTLWLDWERLPPGLDDESRLSLLARWVCDAHGAGLAWGLRLPGRSLKPASGAVHYHRCLQALALHGSN